MSYTHISIETEDGTGTKAGGVLNSSGFSAGAIRILHERYRVIEVKGYTPEHDSEYTEGELILAAGAYLYGPGPTAHDDGTPYMWPWAHEHYKGGSDRIADLVRAGQFIAAEIDRLEAEAEASRNPDHSDIQPNESMAPATLKEPVRKKISAGGKVLKGFRSEGTRLDANPDTLTPTAKVIEPGTGSDPATWFGYGTDHEGEAPVARCCCTTNEPSTRCYRCKDELHETCSDSGANPRPRKHIHDGDTAYDGVCKDCDPTQPAASETEGDSKPDTPDSAGD